MNVARRCCYAFQECNGPTTCVLFPQGAFGVGKLTIKSKVRLCPKKGAALTKADYGLDRRAKARGEPAGGGSLA